MRYFHESHCRLNFFVVNRCYFSDVLQHSNAKTMTSTRGQNVHLVASLFNSSSRLSIPRVTRQLVVEKLFISSRRSLISAFPCSLCRLSNSLSRPSTRRVARQLVVSPVNSLCRTSTRRSVVWVSYVWEYWWNKINLITYIWSSSSLSDKLVKSTFFKSYSVIRLWIVLLDTPKICPFSPKKTDNLSIIAAYLGEYEKTVFLDNL